MSVDAAGHTHVIASGTRGTKGGLWYITDRTGSWTVKRILAWGSGAYWLHPSLALDANGRVHVAVEKAGCIECTIAPAKGIWYLSDVGRPRGTFPATPVRLTPNGTAQPSLRVSGGDRFLAFAGNPDLALKAVKLRTDASGTWTTTTVATTGTSPRLRIGMDGLPRVAWKGLWDIGYAVAATRTGGWTRLVVPGTSDDDADPQLSIDETGGAHISWQDASTPATTVSHISRSGGAWSFIHTVGEGWDHALSVDKPTRPWVAISDDTVRAVVFKSASWQSTTISNDPGRDAVIKVLDSGRVVLIWAGGDPAGIWFARTS
jgi:hypothetical protein